jgi:OOP family OmpA-OmpF porin
MTGAITAGIKRAGHGMALRPAGARACRGLAWAAAALAMVLAGPAAASPHPVSDPVYLFGGASLILEDNGRLSGPATGGRIGVGKRLGDRFGFELSGFYSDFESEAASGGADWEEYGGKLDALYYYSTSRRLVPYFAIGGGLIRSEERFREAMQPGQWTSSDPFGNVGVGLMGLFSLGGIDIGLRGDYRYRFFDIDDIGGLNPFEEHVLSLDLVLPFGGLRPKVAALASLEDRDGDGVPDDDDACPGTVGGAEVDARGCVPDGDGDGVADAADRCPDTAAGRAVDAQGCPQALAREPLEPLLFEYDRAELTDYARAVLETASAKLKQWMAQDEALTLEIAGHTDWAGTEAYNMALSERRSRAVRDYLVRKGVAADRLSTRAFGESKPVASNETEDGRRRNRRVELQALTQ